MTARPASTDELATLVRDAHARGAALRFEGSGRWSDGRSPATRISPSAKRVSLAALSGVVSYVPNDFTLTVRAGTTLAELDAITAMASL